MSSETPAGTMRRAATAMRYGARTRISPLSLVADLLDEIARQYDAPPCDSPAGVCNGCEDFNGALAVARAFLGEETA